MGYRGAGEIPRDNVRVLPWRGGRASRIRHREAPLVRERGAMVARVARPRRPEHTDHARRQQERS